MGAPSLTHAQLHSIDIAARVSACLSLVGVSFTLTSYTCCPALRKPFNRLAFCLAIANAFGCLAYSWGVYPLWDGRNTAFCQTQGFFIQWFVMTDPLLILTMAISVWLRVCAKRSANEIRMFENIAVASAFSLPFIPALVFLIWRPNGLTVYGPAGSWCWISNESNLLRLVSFYAPIWGMILCSIFFFMLSGRRILQIRANVLRTQALYKSESKPRKFVRPISKSFSWPNTAPTTEFDQSQSTSSQPMTPQPTLRNGGDDAPDSPEELVNVPTYTETMNAICSPTGRRSCESERIMRRKSTRFEAMHWKYAKFAFLCTMVLFVTWIPISANRIYNNFINTKNPIYGLYFASALCIPLHGFGNFIIYVNTSWTECRMWVLGLLPKRDRKKEKQSVTSDNAD